MLRLGTRRTLNVVFRRQSDILRYSSSLTSPSHHPNAPLELDPAFQALLRDVEISLRNQTNLKVSGTRSPRELEVFPHDPDTTVDYLTSEELDAQDDMLDHKESRKSPAAAFGSQRIGAVVLPHELQTTIEHMIADSDKHALHQDAKRLFMDLAEWNSSYDVKYKSAKDAGHHALRDATAFATVALPAHYSAIYSVLDHVKQRLGPDWRVQRVIDWGAATGSGLWASGHAFQRNADIDGHAALDIEDTQMSHSSLVSYLGIDKREGLVRIGKRLIRDVETGELSVSWQKSYHEDNAVSREDGSNVMALSAFLLSSLPTHVDRKLLVKEMWESGAEVMVLIDHKFENIAEAREQFLKLGRKELEDPTMADALFNGAHVVAPCPHDGACPLYHPGLGQLECSFSQRLQRPRFVRLTKHSSTGHENMDYSYVVVRRGRRPPPTTMKVGRVGDVGLRELAKRVEDVVPTLSLAGVHGHQDSSEQANSQPPAAGLVSSEGNNHDDGFSSAEMSAALRQEAYNWPRLVFPPLKRSGHIILDSCTPEGKIMRMTIPKSQGKQPFYDARKASWGDLFPHDPKTPPQVRHQSTRPGDTPAEGQDIGKRQHRRTDEKKASYSQLAEEIKLQRRNQRKTKRLVIDHHDA